MTTILQRRWILTATILASSMAFIDGTVVNVALPFLQKELNATAIGVQWVVESYSLFLAALLLVGGSLGDRYGRRLIFVIGVVIFAIASAACGFSATISQLIVARAVQGIGGALLVPGSLAIISASFPEDQRGRAIGTWSGFSAITTAIGPVLGGWLVEHVSWRAVFFLNLPIAIAVVVISLWRVPESREKKSHGSLDWPGAILATLGFGLLVFGLIASSRMGFSHPVVLATIIGGVVVLVAFVVNEARAKNPMVPLELFRSYDFTGANLLTLFLYAALSGTFFFFTLNLIQVQHYSATAAGAALIPFVVLMFSLSRWSGGLVDRFGPRLPLTIGPLIAAIGFALFALPAVTGSFWTSFFPAVLVLGLGMAISVAPLTTTVMGSVDSEQAGVASGINNAVSRAAGLLAIAVFGVVMLQSFGKRLDEKLGETQVTDEVRTGLVAQRVRLAGVEVPTHLDPVTRKALEDAIASSFVSGFRLIMFMSVGLAIASALSAWLLIGRDSRRLRRLRPPKTG
ncbi:MAG: MFS transporter [Acidobacteria bacterium]|nr:MAG: MFS transporter [Acidobacteriota bacterium]